jgi:hypothetical protein
VALQINAFRKCSGAATKHDSATSERNDKTEPKGNRTMGKPEGRLTACDSTKMVNRNDLPEAQRRVTEAGALWALKEQTAGALWAAEGT